jgi:hypothetical protein
VLKVFLNVHTPKWHGYTILYCGIESYWHHNSLLLIYQVSHMSIFW